jgi:hypothetical protein
MKKKEIPKPEMHLPETHLFVARELTTNQFVIFIDEKIFSERFPFRQAR